MSEIILTNAGTKGDPGPPGPPSTRPYPYLLLVGLTTVTSSVNPPSGARMTRVKVNVVTPYTAGATLVVRLNGATPLPLTTVSQVNLQVAGLYVVEMFIPVGAANVGPVQAIIAGAPTVGACEVYVELETMFNT